ncbi:hypothetical protein Esti_006548 [Eimeria stiedai]
MGRLEAALRRRLGGILSAIRKRNNSSTKAEKVSLLLLKLRLLAPLFFIGGVAFLVCLPSFPHPTEVEEYAFSAGQHSAQIKTPNTPAAAALIPSIAAFVYLRLEAASAAAAAANTTAAAPCVAGPLRHSRYPFIFLPRVDVQPSDEQQQQQQQLLPRQQQRCTELHAPAALRELHALFEALQLESVLQPFYLLEPPLQQEGAAVAAASAAAKLAAAGTLHFNLIAVARSGRGDGREAIVLPFLYDFNDPPAVPAAAAAAAQGEGKQRETAAKAVLLQLLQAVGARGAAEALLPATALKDFAAAEWLLLLQQMPDLDSLAAVLKQQGLRVSARVAAAVAAATAKLLQHHVPWLAKDVILVVADRQLPYAAGLRAFAEDYFRDTDAGASFGSGGPLGPLGLGFSRRGPPVHLAVIFDLRGPLPIDPAHPAAAAAAAAAAAIEGEDKEAAAIAAARAVRSRWTDPERVQKNLTQQQQHQQQQQLADYGSLGFIHAEFDGVDGQLVNEDIVNVLLMEVGNEGVPITLRSFWEQVLRPIVGAGGHTSVEPLLRQGTLASATAAVVHAASPGASQGFSWLTMLAGLERMVRSCSNAESALFRSFFSYFFITHRTHVSAGTFIFITPLLVLLVALPLLASRVVCDVRALMLGISSVSAAALAALPVYKAALSPEFGQMVFGRSAAPRCTHWDEAHLLAYTQKAACWLYAAIPAYFLLLLLLVALARYIRQTQLSAKEHSSQQDDPGALFVPPRMQQLLDAAAAAAAAGRAAEVKPTTAALAAQNAATAAASPGARDAEPEQGQRQQEDGGQEDQKEKQQEQQQKQQEEQQEEQQEQQELLQEAAEQMLDRWQPPRAPPALWICIRACCRLLLVAFLLGLLLCNVSMSWFLGLVLLPIVLLAVPLFHDPTSALLLQLQVQQQQQQQQQLKASQSTKPKAAAATAAGISSVEGSTAGDNLTGQQRLQKQRQRRRRLLLRKGFLTVLLLLLLLLFVDVETLRPLRIELYDAVTRAAAAGAAALRGSSNSSSSRKKGLSPELLLEWLGSGVLQQQHQQHHSMPFSFAAAVAAGDGAKAALAAAPTSASAAAAAAAADARWRVQTAEDEEPWSSSLLLPQWLLQQLLPRQPNGLLLLLYGYGRDAACIGSGTFAALVFVVLPLLASLLFIIFLLPA